MIRRRRTRFRRARRDESAGARHRCRSRLAISVSRRAGLDQLQHGIVAERRIAVEVEPRRQAIEHAAGEDRDVDVRRLQAAPHPAMGHGTRPGLTVVKWLAAVGEGRGAAIALEAGVERQVAAVVGMVVAAVAVGLPDLEQAVGHDGALDVMQLQDDLDALAGDSGRGEVGAVGVDDRAPVERADRLRRRERAMSFVDPAPHLTLRSGPKARVSKGGKQSRCCPPFEHGACECAQGAARPPQGEAVVVFGAPLIGHRLFHRRGVAAAQHDVEAVAQRPFGLVSGPSRTTPAGAGARSAGTEL